MFQKITLSNGLKVITVPQKGTKALTVLVLVATGSKYEKKEINGISHLLEHLLFKGTKKRPNQLAIVEPLDKVGGIYNAFTGEEYTGYFAKVGSNHFETALDVISDIYLNSKLDLKDIEKEKGVVIEEINMYFDHPSSYVLNLWEKLLYGDQPAGWGIIGTKKSVNGISRQQMANYIKSQYVAQNTIVCVAGDIGNGNLVAEKVKKYFSGIRKEKPLSKTKVREKQSKPEVLLQERKTDQTHFCLGVRAYDIFHPKKYALDVLASILGGMMSSRLFIKIREELGAAYYINTAVSAFTDSGYLVTHAGVDNQKLEKAISMILEEYRKIADKGVPEEELKKTKDCLIGKMDLLLESSDALASFYGLQEVLEKQTLRPEEICDRINKVSRKEIQQVARDIFLPSKLNLALIGPFKDSEKFKKLLKL